MQVKDLLTLFLALILTRGSEPEKWLRIVDQVCLFGV